MKFRTEIDIKPYPFSISYNDMLLFVGSCFADHIGNYFKKHRFNTFVNPFGTLFNPFSIKLALDLAQKKQHFDEHYIRYFNEKWISFAHHGKFSNSDKELFLTNIRQVIEEIGRQLSNIDYLFITFGTAYYYRHIERDLIVANCHKIPAKEFEKKRASVDRIVAEYQLLCEELLDFNDKLKIVFTVSPIRHLGDGFHENQVSKSILHLAVDELVDNERIFYFPAYEILQDDLRDYRFYAQDLCHPAEQAISYIEEKFEIAFFTPETIENLREIERINKREGHRYNNS
ncbi:GSCFA domain-containing protein [Bacteroidales bacterium OttesenSCG-928-B11]|nr:GSCFA domain-containing protein [Bacteroidales bacterium OttesenSCG-928-E04]MDL2308789.1 GSCFA domain-containing protein [Bacteroidales bacterium OttesenSCG-928-C03]MDL2311989.1 GSCFA domain-containing protein [Bacteroidales bacterium OttesenSCG-928-B11]